jgi:5-methylcytosine-specific restriction enzyme subunit McrC
MRPIDAADAGISFTALEHQAIPVEVRASSGALSVAEADTLSAIGEVRRGFCERGYRNVRLAQYCGVVNLGSRILEILPKVDDGTTPESCRGLLLRLLAESDDFPLFRDLPVGQHLRSASLPELFIAAFMESVHDIVRGGLLRRYERREDDLQVVRGRIAVTRQFGAHANRVDRVSCQFDDLTADHVCNRLVKAALRLTRPWIRTEDLRRRWFELFALFDEVDDAEAKVEQFRQIVYDRQVNRYRAVLMWAEWIFRMLSPALRAGAHAAPGLLFDMNRLFESAVASLLRRRMKDDLRIDSQSSNAHLAMIDGDESSKEYRLRPDLMLLNGPELLAIADTKWKRLEINRQGYLAPNEGDMYQLAAYASALNCRHLSLIYPWHSGLRQSRETTFVIRGGARAMVRVICIDVRMDRITVERGSSDPHIGGLLGRER